MKRSAVMEWGAGVRRGGGAGKGGGNRRGAAGWKGRGRAPQGTAAALGLALVFLLSSAASGAEDRYTELQGSLSGVIAAGLYRVVDDIRIDAGAVLLLEPGVIFEFEDSFWSEYEFDVRGTLLAEGSSTDPIVFRPAPGVPEFNYLRLAGPGSILRHCRIQGAGKITAYDEGGLWIDGSSPLLEDCRVEGGAWHGIYITGSSASPTIRRTVVAGCDGDGIDGDSGAGVTAVNCEIRGNGGDGICLASGANSLIGCLVADNGQDGVDCHGIDDYDAVLVNCTVAGNGSEALSDCSGFRLYNCVAAGSVGDIHSALHCYLMPETWFLGFADPGAGDYRLTDTSPCRNAGTRFGDVAGLLPETDLSGEPRIRDIVDLGAYESAAPMDPGTAGTWFSPALLSPRMTQPEIRIRGEELPVRIAALGAFSPSQAAVRLIDPLGAAHPLSVTGLASFDLVPGSDLSVQVYPMGVETVQEITVLIPADMPGDLYDIEIDLSGREYHSIHAVRVLESDPLEWTFLHITDTHVGYDEEEYTAGERLRFFVREANLLNPDLVVVTGDICENQNLENAAWADSFLAPVAGLAVPICVLPGNHDHYNQSGSFNPCGYFRYFHAINRYANTELRFGPARFYGFNAGHELGALEMYRCLGPADQALDWAEARMDALNPAENRPLFFLMHGPNYDYFSYNSRNTGRVRDLMNAYGVSLCLAGHTHRFETYRNEGENYFGRNDFEHEDDWGRDVPFPGYPLHVQTSALGKEEHLPIPGEPGAGPSRTAPDSSRGLFGDDIAFRVIHVSGGEVQYFTSDTDGDGYRNTEDAWLLGELLFDLSEEPGGAILSTVVNNHHEDWADIRHFIPADPGEDYQVEGGTLLRRRPDGRIEVAVDLLPARGNSVVRLIPAASAVRDPVSRPAPLLAAAGSPFRDHVILRLDGAQPAGSALEDAVGRMPDPNGPGVSDHAQSSRDGARVSLEIYDVRGRLVRDLSDRLPGDSWIGIREVAWDGRDQRGAPAPSGVLFARLKLGSRTETIRLVKVK